MAQVTFRAFSSNGATNGSGAQETIDVTKPAGTVDGDIMFTHIQASTTASFDTVPTGWTLLDSNSTLPTGRFYYRVASSEGSSYQWKISAGGAFAVHIATSTFYNQNSTPVATYTKVEDGSADTVADNTGVTPTASPNALLVAFLAAPTNISFSNYAVADNNPSWTEAYDTGSGSGGNNCEVAMAYGVRNLTTATGAFSADMTGSAQSVVYLFSIHGNLEVTADLLTIDTATPDVSVSAAASITVPALVVDTATLDVTVTEGDPDVVNSDKSTISPSGVSKNAISPTNISKNSISPTNLSKS